MSCRMFGSRVNPNGLSHKCTIQRTQIAAIRIPLRQQTHHELVCHATSNEPAQPPGKCWLVGAGPGPAEYLTVKAVRLLESAHVVIYDDLGAQDALVHTRPDAQLVYVGKRGGRESIRQPQIDELLVDHCRKAQRVVRLKGGCPSVFSRLASEVAALRDAGIDYELVPGISSALAAPLFAGFPLTHAQLSPAFTVLSGHDPAATDWGALRGSGGAVVLLMAGSKLGDIRGRMQAAGWPGDTPVAVVRSAGLPEQRVWHSSLQSVEQDTADAGPLSPCVVIIGQAAAMPAS